MNYQQLRIAREGVYAIVIEGVRIDTARLVVIPGDGRDEANNILFTSGRNPLQTASALVWDHAGFDFIPTNETFKGYLES